MKAVRNLKLQNGSEINRTGDVKRPLFRSLLARPFWSVPINRCKLIMQSSRTTLWLIYETMYAALKNMNTGNFSMTTQHKYLSPHLWHSAFSSFYFNFLGSHVFNHFANSFLFLQVKYLKIVNFRSNPSFKHVLLNRKDKEYLLSLLRITRLTTVYLENNPLLKH